MDAGVQSLNGTSVAGDGAPGVIHVDGGIHPASAVTRVCYALAELATFEISSAENSIAVRIHPAGGRSLDDVIRHFHTSLVDFTLREDIEARTKEIRTLIWQTAFGEARQRGGR